MNDEPPSPSPWVTSITGTPAPSSAGDDRRTCSLGELVALGVRPVAQARVGDADRGPRGRPIERRQRSVRAGCACVMRRHDLAAICSPTGRRRRHDVEVAGVRRQVVAGALDLDEDRDRPPLVPSEGRRTAALEQPVAGHVAAAPRDHRRDRCGDRVVSASSGISAEDRVAHDQRRVGRVEDDDRLAASRRRRALDAAGGRAW